MACRNAYKTKTINSAAEMPQTTITEPAVAQKVNRLLFGGYSKIQSDDILQNNGNQFEWVLRNKIHPNFWGRNIVGENALTKEEIRFLHNKGCKIAAVYVTSDEKQTEEQGTIPAKKMDIIALELGIPEGAAIFLELGEKDVFNKSLLWAVVPTAAEYDRMTTAHLIHPDNRTPYAPSGIARNEIAVWQYGKNCYPINDDADIETTFNLEHVGNEQVIIEKMF